MYQDSPVLYNIFDYVTIQQAIIMLLSTGSSIECCLVENHGADGISFWGNATGLRIFGNRVKSCGDDHIALNAQNNDYPSNTSTNMRDIAITGNVLGPGTTPFGNGIDVAGAFRVAISGNAIYDMVGDGIRVVGHHIGSGGGAQDVSDVSITGNTVATTGAPGGPRPRRPRRPGPLLPP